MGGARHLALLRSREALVGASTKLVNHRPGTVRPFGIRLPDALPPSHRSSRRWRAANLQLAIIGGGTDDFTRRWEHLVPLLDGSYLSFETDTGPGVPARAFPAGHLKRPSHLAGGSGDEDHGSPT